MVASLPVYSNQFAPKGQSWHLLKVESGSAQAAQTKLDPGQYLVSAQGEVNWLVRENFATDLKAPKEALAKQEKLSGPQGADDTGTYWVWQKTTSQGGPAGRYLTDAAGKVVYLVDPGINGVYSTRPDGTTVAKFDAPKATLMSYIIKGILNRELPWALVLLGVMIAVVLEMACVPSLAFAVGVYLPISSSSPIFIGGLIRWLVDQHLKKRMKDRNLTPEELTAETDKSPGVLLASGYIAGGAIAGIIIAFMAGVLVGPTQKITEWAEAHNPFFNGPHSDLLSLLPFALISVVLYFIGKARNSGKA
jgi:hypothetical protein